ncbi:protein KASH5-like [Sceloporus undulatus]|uniref:protein KASH5-like n=1 Tax=Sceloporus undulatus TaxID=8520 RepID=UPI001C4BCCBF|nr:protein KASH5-like [Sceloporus undulatus]
MSLSTDFSEDDIISITFEVCSTRETGVAPASTFIKYLEGVTGHSRDHSKLLLLYDMLDPKRQNILVDKETFHTVMKKWIAICYQDCISESEYERYRTMSNGNIQYNDMMPYLSDEDAEIFEGSGKDSEMICGLNSSIEEIKYTNQRMAEQLHGILKVMETSEETYLQLTDDIADLRDTVKSMEKPLRNFKNVYKELEDTKSKMANLHEENHMIRECVTSLVLLLKQKAIFVTESTSLRL